MAKSQESRDDSRKGSIDERIDGLLTELRMSGFAAAKQIILCRGETGGQMKCPMCQQRLLFRLMTNGHLHTRCETKHCLNICE